MPSWPGYRTSSACRSCCATWRAGRSGRSPANSGCRRRRSPTGWRRPGGRWRSASPTAGSRSPAGGRPHRERGGVVTDQRGGGKGGEGGGGAGGGGEARNCGGGDVLRLRGRGNAGGVFEGGDRLGARAGPAGLDAAARRREREHG